MKRLILTLGLVCLVAVVAFAQAKTDFSGTWTPEQTAAPPPPAGGGGGRGAGGGPMTITQKGNDFIIERTSQAGTSKMVYKLDGTESVNEMPARGGGSPTQQKSKCKWDGAKLVITTTMEGQNGPVETVATYALKDASTLTIDSVRAGGQPTTRTYTKGK
jgi:hypothetical protein